MANGIEQKKNKKDETMIQSCMRYCDKDKSRIDCGGMQLSLIRSDTTEYGRER